MHFQTPPYAHKKIVTIVSGKAFDVILDLRKGSKTFGMHETFLLDAAEGTSLFLPEGIAHGFQALTDGTILHYQVSTAWSKEHDVGIRWDSFGVQWPLANPIISEKDKAHVEYKSFSNPFVYV